MIRKKEGVRKFCVEGSVIREKDWAEVGWYWTGVGQALGRAWVGAAVEAGIWAGPHSNRIGAGLGRAGQGWAGQGHTCPPPSLSPPTHRQLGISCHSSTKAFRGWGLRNKVPLLSEQVLVEKACQALAKVLAASPYPHPRRGLGFSWLSGAENKAQRGKRLAEHEQ